MKTETVNGIEYILPKVTMLKESGLGVAEYAARTCYDSFENSENEAIRNSQESLDLDALNSIEGSELLMTLAWVHHHHSIIEHATLSFLVEGTSRGVLQEHARHRLQNISVRSTRYTMSSVINAFVAAQYTKGRDGKDIFMFFMRELDLLVITGEMAEMEYSNMFDKLYLHLEILGAEEFYKTGIAKSSLAFLDTPVTDSTFLYKQLQEGKKKRNVGDAFKGYLVTDSWKVDMVITFNIRSLKNYFGLRDSGAAFFQIRWLAEEMKKATPLKYLKLIDKKAKEEG